MPRGKRKIPLPKTRNGGTLTEAGFWSFIRSGLRQKSRWWKPITDCKLSARRPYTGTNKRLKFEYQCNHCKKWFPEKDINVDHIVQAGALNCAADLPEFVEKLFCEEGGFQVLCETCHGIKTKAERSKSKK